MKGQRFIYDSTLQTDMNDILKRLQTIERQYAAHKKATGPHVPVGGIVFANIAAADIATYFDTTGLGIENSAWEDWAVCNGSNGTPDLEAKFLRMRDDATGAGGTGGTDSSAHTHSVDVAAYSGTSGSESSHTHGMQSHTHGRGSFCAELSPATHGPSFNWETTSQWTCRSYYATSSGSAGDTSNYTAGIPIIGTSDGPSNNTTTAGSSHSHSIDHDHPSVTSGAASATDNKPAYYELLPIMRIA